MKIQIFGILNVTPDSFSDGGKFLRKDAALTHAEKLINDGADFIDIGGESTRPHATELTADGEWKRIGEIVEPLVQKYPGKISLDSHHPETILKFAKLGGTIINDVFGFQAPRMRELAAKFQTEVVLMHFPGKTLDEVHAQSISSPNQVRDELLARKEILIKSGISEKKIILDPGIGFGKTPELNWELLKFAALVPRERVLIGHSRKRFLGDARFEIDRNLEAAEIAVKSGAKYLRVHDVAEHVRTFAKK